MKYPEIDPVALSVGPLDIRWYALAYLAGILLGWKYVLYLCREAAPGKEAVDDFIPWAILGIILGGRIGYILFYQPDMVIDDPLEIFRVWHGGMSFHGGMAGVAAAMTGFALRRGIRVLLLSDLVCCAAPIGLFFGRLANFVNGELFGRETVVPWGMAFPRGGPFPRHPSQIYEALLEGALLFCLLVFLAHKDKIRATPGVLTGVFLCGYACARMFVEFFREPDSQIGYIAGMFTMGQVLCVPMLLAGLIVLFYARSAGRARA